MYIPSKFQSFGVEVNNKYIYPISYSMQILQFLTPPNAMSFLFGGSSKFLPSIQNNSEIIFNIKHVITMISWVDWKISEFL